MMFYSTIDTIVTAVVSSITVLLVMVIITSLVTVIICMKTSRQKSTPGILMVTKLNQHVND